MPVPTAMVGDTVEPFIHDVDERWTMAYAAGLGCHQPQYLDTRRPGGVIAHPVFAVCVEWPVIVRSRDLSDRWGLTPDEVRRSVHASHDLTVHRPIRPGDRLTTTLEVAGVEQRRSGTFSTTVLRTVDADGAPVATTVQGGMYLGVAADGPDRPAPDDLAPPLPRPDTAEATPAAEVVVPISAGAAHTYTECARIWNPIHTDVAVAEGAGLPDIILHGTATLAHGVTEAVRVAAGDDAGRVRRIVGRFGAMVLMPSDLTVRVWDAVPLDDGTDLVPFDVRTVDGGPAVDGGALVVGP